MNFACAQGVSQLDVRLLLDQNFPKPKGFDMSVIDANVEPVHLHDHKPSFSMDSTPDWLVMYDAFKSNFDALATRDLSQLRQALEMFTLSKLKGFTVIVPRARIEDPVTEWAQLVAFLPLIRQRVEDNARDGGTGHLVVLPRPTLGPSNNLRARAELAEIERRLGVSHHQMESEAREAIRVSLPALSLNTTDLPLIFPT